MLFERRIEIPLGFNPYLEKSALHLILSCLPDSSFHTFREDGIENEDGLLQSYDGNPKHLVCISFASIQEYCKEHNLEYQGGVDDSTGMDMCTVSKKKEP